eukprot:358758_1
MVASREFECGLKLNCFVKGRIHSFCWIHSEDENENESSHWIKDGWMDRYLTNLTTGTAHLRVVPISDFRLKNDGTTHRSFISPVCCTSIDNNMMLQERKRNV